MQSQAVLDSRRLPRLVGATVDRVGSEGLARVGVGGKYQVVGVGLELKFPVEEYLPE